MEDKQFWTVWNPNGRVPMVQHETERSATQEAERLAKQCQGEAFFVLEAVSSRCVNSMHRVNLRPEELPF